MPGTLQPRLLSATLPSLASELGKLLAEADEAELASQVPGLEIVERCCCGDDFCATFYIQPKPVGSYGPDHRSVVLNPEKGYLIIDAVAGRITCVEVLYRDEIREALNACVP